jgi:hypothetical protein
MESPRLWKNLAAAAALVVAVVLCGCPEEPAKPDNPKPKQETPAPPAGKASDSQKAAIASPKRPNDLAESSGQLRGNKEEVDKQLKEAEAQVGEKAKPAAEPGTEQSEETPKAPAATEPENPFAAPPAAPAKTAAPPKAVPLGCDMKDLTSIDHCSPAWMDLKHKEVIVVGETCKAEYPLEFFATLRDRGYEAAVVVDTPPRVVHAALVLMGAKPGHPVRFDPKFEPPTGTEVLIEVRWKDKDGKVKTAPAQQWIRNIQTKKALDVNWVFAGSRFLKNPETGKEIYAGDSGDFVSVLNLPTATLDLPIRSRGALESRLFEGFVDNMPPAKTPVTIVFRPKVEEKKAAGGPGAAMEKWLNKGNAAGKGGIGSGFGDTTPDAKEETDKDDKAAEGTDKDEK